MQELKVGELAQRRLGLAPYPTPLLAAWLMLDGQLAEVATGEGKTLAAGLGAAATALGGVPPHLLTANDYLAQRDEAAVAGGRTDQASERRKLAQREVDLAAAQLSQRSTGAPISGVVVERFMSPGEFVDQKPILRLAAIDPLRVDVLVPAVAFGQVEPGMKGSVMPELLQKREHIAVVKTVDRVIDAAAKTFRVRLELSNPDGTLPAGLRCKVDLGLKLPGPPAPAAAPAAAALVAPAGVAPVVARN